MSRTLADEAARIAKMASPLAADPVLHRKVLNVLQEVVTRVLSTCADSLGQSLVGPKLAPAVSAAPAGIQEGRSPWSAAIRKNARDLELQWTVAPAHLEAPHEDAFHLAKQLQVSSLAGMKQEYRARVAKFAAESAARADTAIANAVNPHRAAIMLAAADWTKPVWEVARAEYAKVYAKDGTKDGAKDYANDDAAKESAAFSPEMFRGAARAVLASLPTLSVRLSVVAETLTTSLGACEGACEGAVPAGAPCETSELFHAVARKFAEYFEDATAAARVFRMSLFASPLASGSRATLGELLDNRRRVSRAAEPGAPASPRWAAEGCSNSPGGPGHASPDDPGHASPGGPGGNPGGPGCLGCYLFQTSAETLAAVGAANPEVLLWQYCYNPGHYIVWITHPDYDPTPLAEYLVRTAPVWDHFDAAAAAATLLRMRALPSRRLEFCDQARLRANARYHDYVNDVWPLVAVDALPADSFVRWCATTRPRYVANNGNAEMVLPASCGPVAPGCVAEWRVLGDDRLPQKNTPAVSE